MIKKNWNKNLLCNVDSWLFQKTQENVSERLILQSKNAAIECDRKAREQFYRRCGLK